MGWMSVALMAALYYVVPVLSGKSIVWPRLIEWIFWIFVVCTGVGSVLMITGGIVAGSAFAAGVKGAQLESIIVPYAMPAGLLCTISVIAGLMFVVQILVSLTRKVS
jgi:cbb3-type cytochrome oxidase subunit 1